MFPVVPVIGGNSLVAVAPAVIQLQSFQGFEVGLCDFLWIVGSKQTKSLDNIICFILFYRLITLLWSRRNVRSCSTILATCLTRRSHGS